GIGSAPGGGVPPPARTYRPRKFAYSSGVGKSTVVSPPKTASSNSRSRNGRHQPQPVPAPKHSLSWAGRLGFSMRMKLTTLRCVTWKQRQSSSSGDIGGPTAQLIQQPYDTTGDELAANRPWWSGSSRADRA